MAKVTILVGGRPATVEETSPGLFGKLGYQYASGGPATPTPQPSPQPSPIQNEVKNRATSTPATAPATTFTRQLDPGATGEDVRALQKFLNTQGHQVSSSGAGAPGSETDYFGPLTKAALQKYQLAQGLEGIGRVGPKTLGLLNTPAGGGTTTPTPEPGVTPTGALTNLGGQPGQSAQETVVNRLIDALQKSTPAGGYEGAYKEAKKTAGIPELETKVGTFDEEIVKARDLLSTFDAQLRRGMNKEEARLAPMELVTGRQAELQRQAGETRGDLLGVLDKLTTGKTLALQELTRREQDVLTTLGFKEKDLSRPLEDLKTELTLRNSIQELVQTQFPEAVSQTFNDQGDLTILLRDPNTGEFSTKVVKGIGKVKGTTTGGGGKKAGGGGTTGGGGGGSDFDAARNYVQEHSDQSDSSLINWVRENTELNISDATRVVDEFREQGKPGGQFLNKDYFKKVYTEDQLNQAANVSEDEGGLSWFDRLKAVGKQTEIESYLDKIMQGVEQRRALGMSDDQILKEMLK